MVDLGQKKVNSRLPFFIGPNRKGWRTSQYFQYDTISGEPFLIFPKLYLPFLPPKSKGVANQPILSKWHNLK